MKIECLNCHDEVEVKDSTRKFCGKSCAASYNNKGVRRHGKEPGNCLLCDAKLDKSEKKYCNNLCQKGYEWKLTKKEIEETGVGKYKVTTKRYLLETRGRSCEICLNTEWRGQPIGLIMDHINGNSEDNRIENLRLVCGNCDMQLPTYKNKNKGSGRAYRRKRYAEGNSY